MKITAVSILLLICGWIFFHWILPGHFSMVYPLLLLLFYLFTLLSHNFQTKAIDKGFNRFAQTNMIITIVRLFFFSAVIVLYLIWVREQIAGFITATALLYIIFSFLETRELTRYSRKISGGDIR